MKKVERIGRITLRAGHATEDQLLIGDVDVTNVTDKVVVCYEVGKLPRVWFRAVATSVDVEALDVKVTKGS